MMARWAACPHEGLSIGFPITAARLAEPVRMCAMASDKKIAANRRNAQSSTGPRTANGKARSRSNARRHGLSIAIGATEEVRCLAAALVASAPPHARSAQLSEAALVVAEAAFDLQRVNAAKRAVMATVERELESKKAVAGAAPSASADVVLARAYCRALPLLQRLDRYGRRAFSRHAAAKRVFARQVATVDAIESSLGE
jgi:hypothetical protein